MVVLSRLVQGQLDLFWVAVQTSVPFLIVGICLGAQAASWPSNRQGSGSRPSEPLEKATSVTDRADRSDVVHVCCTDAFAGVERHVSELAAAQAALGTA